MIETRSKLLFGVSDPNAAISGQTALSQLDNDVNSSNTTLSYYNYQFDGVGDRTSLWDNGVDVSNWNYDCSGQLTNDVYRPATTALNWNGLTVDQWFLLDEDGWDNLLADHVPTGGAGLLAYSPSGNWSNGPSRRTGLVYNEMNILQLPAPR